MTTEDAEAGTEGTEEIPADTRMLCELEKLEEGHSVYFLRDPPCLPPCPPWSPLGFRRSAPP